MAINTDPLEELNPARRLEVLLGKLARGLKGQQSLYDLWAAALFPTEAKPAIGSVLHGISDALELERTARAFITEALGQPLPIHTGPLDQARQAFARYDLNAGSVDIGSLVSTAHSMMQHVCYTIEVLGKGRAIPTTALVRLRARTLQLVEAILSSDLPESIRADMLYKARALLEAIENVWLRGPEAVSAAADAISGASGRYQPWWKSSARVFKYAAVVGRIAMWMTNAYLTYQRISGDLPPGPNLPPLPQLDPPNKPLRLTAGESTESA